MKIDSYLAQISKDSVLYSALFKSQNSKHRIIRVAEIFYLLDNGFKPITKGTYVPYRIVTNCFAWWQNLGSNNFCSILEI